MRIEQKGRYLALIMLFFMLPGRLYDSTPITHRGLKSEFGRILIKPAYIEEEYNVILQEARDQRQIADYATEELDLLPDIDFAREIVEKAERFLKRMERLIDEK